MIYRFRNLHLLLAYAKLSLLEARVVDPRSRLIVRIEPKLRNWGLYLDGNLDTDNVFDISYTISLSDVGVSAEKPPETDGFQRYFWRLVYGGPEEAMAAIAELERRSLLVPNSPHPTDTLLWNVQIDIG